MDCSLELDPEKVCRVCLQQKDNQSKLFTKHIIEGVLRSLPDIIKSTFLVPIVPDPNLPHKICDCCLTSVIEFFKFKERFVRSEELLAEIFKTESKISLKQEQFDVEEYDEQPLEDGDGSIVDLEESLGGEYEDQYLEEIHVDIVNDQEEEEEEEVEDQKIVFEEDDQKVVFDEDLHNTEDQEYEVEKQNDIVEDELSNMEFIDEESTPFDEFEEDTYLEEIEQIEESDQDEIIIEPQTFNLELENAPKKRRYRRKDGESKASQTLMCKVCNKRIKIEDENEDHDKLHDYYALIVSTETFLQCFKCDVIFICPDELNSHVQQMHYGEENTFGGVQILDEDDIMRTSWDCGHCNVDFNNISEMKMHMVTHLGKISCPVDECGFEYGNFHYFYQHIRRNHLSSKLLTCKYCGKENIPDFRTLQNHYRTECTAKNYKCVFCPRTFFTDKSWKTHMDIRHIEKKFVCEQCGKAFAQITELRIHMRMHTGERPFECTICKKAYKTASGRASHMDSHSNKIFTCDICGKHMNSKRNLVTHVRRHTEEKTHKCDVCEKRFFTKWHLNLHASKMHNKS